MSNSTKASNLSYSTNDPKGWCGNPSRGAALGRRNLRGDVSFDGKLVLRKIAIDSGGYDCNGTYFGHGEPIYWFAAEATGDDADSAIDCVIRAKNRQAAKEAILEEYPDAKFYR